MDVLRSGEEFLLGGFERPHSHQLPVVYMIKMDSGFQVLNVINLTSQTGLHSISRIRRFDQNNNFVAACDNSLVIYDISERRAWKLADVMTENIGEFCICKDTIVLKGEGMGPFKMIKIDESIKSIYDTQIGVGGHESGQPAKPDAVPATQTQNQVPPASSNLASPQASYSQPRESVEVIRKGPDILTKSDNSVSGANQKSSLSLSRMTSRPQPPIVYTSNKYENYSLMKIPVPGSGGLEKVTANKKLNKIFCCSSKQIHLLEFPSNQIGIPIVIGEGETMNVKNTLNLSIFRPNIDISGFGVKLTPSNHLIIHENGSNDLIILDGTGTEVTRYKAKSKFIFSRFSIIQPQPT